MRRWLGSGTAILLLLLAMTPSAAAQQLDSAAEETAYLLKQAITSRNPSQRDRLLQTLRRMRDPAAAPIYQHLAGVSDPVRQGHGILGLAETGTNSALTIDTVLAITDPRAQAEIVSAALNDKLLSIEQAAQWVTSTQLSQGSRLVLARHLIREGKTVDTAFLRSAANGDDRKQRIYAHILLAQSGDAGALEPLRALFVEPTAESKTEAIAALNLAAESNFDKLGPWALEVSQNASIEQAIAQPAFGIALRLGAPQTQTLWRRMFTEATSTDERMRLAMQALFASPWLDAGLFDTLIASDDAIIQTIGRAGKAVASKQNVDAAVLELIQLHHVPLCEWALGYAMHEAKPEVARTIYLGLILSFNDALGTTPAAEAYARVAEQAAQSLYDQNPEEATPLLREIVSDPNVNPLFVRRIVLRLLMRCEEPGSDRVVKDVAFKDRTTKLLALVLAAKGSGTLAADDLSELALVVRGGGNLPDEVRLQAGWAYVKRTNQLEATLAKVLK